MTVNPWKPATAYAFPGLLATGLSSLTCVATWPEMHMSVKQGAPLAKAMPFLYLSVAFARDKIRAAGHT